jgi:putative Ca2+/H+ antiporter (TMEM165/GDT1 family)
MAYLLVTLTAFVLILSVELPDRTFVAMLVLGARLSPLPAWLGVVVALGLRCLVAVAAGTLLAGLPEPAGVLVAAGLFAAGAVLLLRGARQAGVELAEEERRYADRITFGRRGWRAAGTGLEVLLAAQWRGRSPLLTAGLVAGGLAAVPVFVGSWLALAAISGAAVLLGGRPVDRIRPPPQRYVGAAMSAGLAMLAVVTGLA